MSGQRFEVQHVPEEALLAQRAAARDSMEESFAALTLGLARLSPGACCALAVDRRAAWLARSFERIRWEQAMNYEDRLPAFFGLSH